jgi:hypothetical protein
VYFIEVQETKITQAKEKPRRTISNFLDLILSEYWAKGNTNTDTNQSCGEFFQGGKYLCVVPN